MPSENAPPSPIPADREAAAPFARKWCPLPDHPPDRCELTAELLCLLATARAAGAAEAREEAAKIVEGFVRADDGFVYKTQTQVTSEIAAAIRALGRTEGGA